MKNLAQKIAKIIPNLKPPKQSGYHGGKGGFNYSTRNDILNVVRQRLADEGVVLFTSSELVKAEPINNSKNIHAVVTLRVTMVDTDSGDSVETTCVGEAVMSDGKAIAAANTQAARYWFFNAFQLENGEIEGNYRRSQPPEHQNVQRQQASTSTNDDLSAIHTTLKRLDFSDQQVSGWDQYMASCANASSIEQTPAGIIKRFRDRFSEMGDDQIRKTVVNMLGADEAA